MKLSKKTSFSSFYNLEEETERKREIENELKNVPLKVTMKPSR